MFLLLTKGMSFGVVNNRVTPRESMSPACKILAWAR